VISFDVPNGTFVCPAAGCNSGQFVSFVGGVANPSGTFTVVLPTGSIFTIDGAAGFTPFISGVPQCSPPAIGHRCFAGTFGFNAFQEVSTPTSTTPGEPVTITDTATFYNPLTGGTVPVKMEVTFEGA
jgi:hypothetical protein